MATASARTREPEAERSRLSSRGPQEGVSLLVRPELARARRAQPANPHTLLPARGRPHLELPPVPDPSPAPRNLDFAFLASKAAHWSDSDPRTIDRQPLSGPLSRSDRQRRLDASRTARAAHEKTTGCIGARCRRGPASWRTGGTEAYAPCRAARAAQLARFGHNTRSAWWRAHGAPCGA